MKRITSKHQKEKKQKRNQLILAVLLIIIMMFSVLGYGFIGNTRQSSEETLNYNGYEFILQNGFWVLPLENFNLVFSYNPEQTENTNTESLAKNFEDYSQKTVYIHSENPDAESEIYTNLYPFTANIQQACFQGENCTNENLPVKTCNDNLIVIQEKETDKIYQQENCVFIQGQNLAKLSDKFLYRIFGIQ